LGFSYDIYSDGKINGERFKSPPVILISRKYNITGGGLTATDPGTPAGAADWE
jgi:hypothetical protein